MKSRLAGVGRSAVETIVRGFGYDAEQTAAWARKLEEVDPERAGRLYRQAIGQPPKSARVRVDYARYLVERCHDEELAAHYIREAAELAPTDVHILTDFVRFMRSRPGGVAEAIERLERALLLQSDEWLLVLVYAELLAEADRNLERAGPFLEEILRAHPEDGMAHHFCGMVYSNWSDRVEEAERCIRTAAELSPREWCIARHAGDFFLSRVPDADAAEDHLHRATELDGSDHRSLFHLAELLRVVRGDMDGAEAANRRSITVAAEPHYFEALATFLCTMRNRPDEAEATYRLAINLSFKPHCLRPRFAYFLLRVRDDADGARRQLEAAVEESGRAPDFVLSLAAFLAFELSETAAAERLFEEVVGRPNPGAVDLSLYAAFVSGYLKDVNRAEALFRRALSLSPADPYVLINYGCFLTERGRVEDGARLLDAVASRSTGVLFEDWNLAAFLLALMLGPVERRPALLAKVKAALVVGERSPFSHVNPSLIRVEAANDPFTDWWKPLIEVVTMRSPIEVLDS